ncbi:MAG: DUF1512 family protein [Candidatus Aenigmarchaeota archaeon]|nr:DUF1512 family protein [Candidatus Aenigmarchaeota archaeon]
MALNFISGDNPIMTFLFFILFFMFYPRIMLWQMTYKLENNLIKLKQYSEKSQSIIMQKFATKTKDKKKAKDRLVNFMDFFIVPPVSIDPAGIIPKLDKTIKESDRKVEYVVRDIAGSDIDEEEMANLKMSLMGAMMTNQIFKIFRHFMILIKKSNNLQLAMILQMQIPMLMNLAKANLRATKCFSNGVPIGDSIGPMVSASFMSTKPLEIAKDVVVTKETVEKKTTYFMKAKGPGSRLGEVGDAVEKAIKRYKIDYVITVDAAGKLEGEKTGVIAEGVGIAMGGVGVQRSKIENAIFNNKRHIAIDALAVKQAPIEASIAMKKEIFGSLKRAQDKLKELIKESDAKSVLVIGVGNTSGIKNNKKTLESDVEKLLKPDWAIYQRKKKIQEKKKKSLWYRLFGPKEDEDDEFLGFALGPGGGQCL